MEEVSEGILEVAARITGVARGENYGHLLPNHLRIAMLRNGYLVGTVAACS